MGGGEGVERWGADSDGDGEPGRKYLGCLCLWSWGTGLTLFTGVLGVPEGPQGR